MVIIDEGIDWRRASDTALAEQVERLWSTRFMTTLGIATFLRVPEARVWNIRARRPADTSAEA